MGLLRERLCKQTYAPPYATSIRAYAFVLQGDANAIAQNVVQPGLGDDYTPADVGFDESLFALAFLHYEDFRSTAATDVGKGRISYNESALVNLVEDDVGRRFIFTPSLYLDKSAPIISGLTFGFPKSWGEVSTPPPPTGGPGIELLTRGDEVAKFDPLGGGGDLAKREVIYTASQRPGFAPIDIKAFDETDIVDIAQKAFTEASQYLLSTNPALLVPALALFETLAFWRAPLRLLKQLPSATTPNGNAAYQAHVTIDAEVTAIRELAILGPFDITLCDFDSAPLARSYGVGIGPLTSVLGFYVDLDVKLTTADEVAI